MIVRDEITSPAAITCIQHLWRTTSTHGNLHPNAALISISLHHPNNPKQPKTHNPNCSHIKIGIFTQTSIYAHNPVHSVQVRFWKIQLLSFHCVQVAEQMGREAGVLEFLFVFSESVTILPFGKDVKAVYKTLSRQGTRGHVWPN